MASPQKENGFTPIANELLRALIRHNLPGRQIRIWLALAIDSYGRSRKETTLSIGQISKMTGIARQNVSRELSALLVSRMILVGGRLAGETSGKITRRISKDYDGWVVSPMRPGLKDETRPSLKDETTPRTRASLRKKRTTPANPEVRQLTDLFFKGQEKALGQRPGSFPGGQLGKFFKSLLANGKTFSDIQARIAAWFESTDPYPKKEAFRAGAFISKFDSLTLNKNQGIPLWMQAK